jgi:hypothetical protein
MLGLSISSSSLFCRIPKYIKKLQSHETGLPGPHYLLRSSMADAVEAIARPLAGKKLNKKIHKVIKKGAWGVSRLSFELIELTKIIASRLRQVKRGVKEVVKSIRKGEKGFVILCRTFLYFSAILVHTSWQDSRPCGRHNAT